MPDDLERILSVDEECRSRVAFAQTEMDRATEDAARERVRSGLLSRDDIGALRCANDPQTEEERDEAVRRKVRLVS
jgi:hypothetical protein